MIIHRRSGSVKLNDKIQSRACDTSVSLHFDAVAAAPWGCGGLWWSVKHCGVSCPVSRLIHLKLYETAGIARSYGTAAKLNNSS